MVKTDHDETKAMKDVEDRHQGVPPRHGVTDFDYGNVLDRGQHGPNRDPRLVNSNYALIGNLDNMERGNPPDTYGQGPLINEPDNVDHEPTPESINRPPSVAQSMNPNYGRVPVDQDEPLGRSLSAEDLKESGDWKQNSEQQLYLALDGLDERSRDILAQRWLSEDKATLHDLAAKYGVSAERIRQLEQNAMKKLRASIAA